MSRYGYMLLDRTDPDVNRQALQLDTIGEFDRIFVDRRQAGDDVSSRSQRARMIDQLGPDDVVFCASVDRLCDNLKDLILTVNDIIGCQAHLAILQEGLDSRSAAGMKALRLLESVNRLEFEYQSERKKAGIRAARKQGRRIGRPPVSIPPGFRDICKAWSEGQISGIEAIRRSGLKSTSFYKKAGELGFKAPPRNPLETEVKPK